MELEEITPVQANRFDQDWGEQLEAAIKHFSETDEPDGWNWLSGLAKKVENLTGGALWQHTLNISHEGFQARQRSHTRGNSSLSKTAFALIKADKFLDQMHDRSACSSEQQQQGIEVGKPTERLALVSLDDPSPKAAKPEAPPPEAPPPPPEAPPKAAPPQLK